MKLRKCLITLTIAGLMAVLLCLPGPAVAGGNPVTPGDTEKLIGPNVQATVIMGWRPDTSVTPGVDGIITAFIRVNDQLYVVEDPGTAEGFIGLFYDDTNNFNIPFGAVNLSDRLPQQIAIDLGMGSQAFPTIFEEKDVSDYQLRCFDTTYCIPEADLYEPNYGPGVGPDVFKLAAHATVKISFVVPQTGPPAP